MKLIISTLVSLLFTGAFLSAQMPGMMTMQKASAPQGTTLGANTTSGAAGIALGNRVVMRGYVDFKYGYQTKSDNPVPGPDKSDFTTKSDIDFLFDFSPVTGEVHLAMNPNPATAGVDQIGLEQAFARYSFNRDFHITFGRQLTSLAFDDDETPGLYSVTSSYQKAGSGAHFSYNDGIRANFNNGRFGFILGLYDGYWEGNDFNNDNVGIDIAASLMIVPGLEYRIGYAHNGVQALPFGGTAGLDEVDDDITQFNTWLSYKTGALTLALEYDKYDRIGMDISDIMMLASYQFSDLIAASIRYVYEDVQSENLFYKNANSGSDSDRISLAVLFSITQNFGLNLEYSHWAVNSTNDYTINEFYIQGLLSF
ncbi:MAG: hypothetical protein HN548_12800 [Opitutae bacterium]|nr:hypothetical protein [Opitutae bacterium]